MPDGDVKKTIYLPALLLERIADAAHAERRSFNAEVVLALETAYMARGELAVKT